jgi:hypothetical protein
MSNIPARASRTQQYSAQTDEVEEVPDSYYETRPPTSARRYVDTRGNQVIQQGNRRVVIHKEAPPSRRFHWMVFMGLFMFVMVLGWMLLTAASYWWQQRQDDWKYGSPFRTFQVDQYVAMGDTPQIPDHFLALNIHGSIEVVQLNPAAPKYDHVYPITTVNDSSIPVFLSFEDTNHDGKLDMLVTIGDSNSYTVILLNNGTQFSH